MITFVLLGLAGLVHAVQRSFTGSTFEPYDAGLFTPFGNLSALATSEFTSLRHPYLPNYSVRIKESQFCDGDVKAYTGYIDVEARHLFFYFFESRRDPDVDDVVFYTTGGPGGSSAMGLFMELGPCRVTSPNTTKRFEDAWNNQANVFFIDQPVGVGFSYADYGEYVSSTHEAANDISSFMVIFFEHFSKFKGRSFHMAGTSYAGRYIPVFASAIYDRNAELTTAGMDPINLTSVMIGNGGTDRIGLELSQYDVQCMDFGFPKVTSISDCVRMKQLIPRCVKRVEESCRNIMDRVDCKSAFYFCFDAVSHIFTKVNPFNAKRPCTENPEITACYPILADIESFLNIPSVQESLGVDPQRSNFSWLSLEVNAHFSEDHWSFRAEHYLAALLERGVKALIYVGVDDWICNWVGNERMTFELEWSGQQEYNSQPLREWYVDGEAAGKTRSWGQLTFATIYDAGHMAPYDQPERSHELAKRWLAGGQL